MPVPVTSWAGFYTGNFGTSARWDSGTPDSTKNAFIAASGGTYTVTLDTLQTARSLTLDALGATLNEKATGGLTTIGALKINAGLAILTGTQNSFAGGVFVQGGTLRLQQSTALGNTAISLGNQGHVEVAHSMTLSNAVNLKGWGGIGALGTETLTYSGDVHIAASTMSHLSLGGSVVWDATGSYAAADDMYSVGIAGGTLATGNGNLSLLLGHAKWVDIGTDGTLDLGPFATFIAALQGDGIVRSSSHVALSVGGGMYDGSFAGKLDVKVTGDFSVGGASSNTGNWTILSGDMLTVTGGSFAANSTIINKGILEFNTGNLFHYTLNNSVSGAGSVSIGGMSFVALNHVNSYSGGTNVVDFSTLSLGSQGALGSGLLRISNSTISSNVASNNLDNQMIMSGNVIFSTEHDNQTLILNQNKPWSFNASTMPGSIQFGDGAHASTFKWFTPSGSSFAGANPFNVYLENLSTLEIGGGFNAFSSHSGEFWVNGILDPMKHNFTAGSLFGDGVIDDSVGLANLTLTGFSFFQGDILRLGTLFLNGNTILNGEDHAKHNVVGPGAALLVSGIVTGDVVLNANSQLGLAGEGNEIAGGVSGLHTENTVYFALINFDTASFDYNTTTKTLTLNDGTHEQALTLNGSYAIDNFHFSEDAQGHVTMTVEDNNPMPAGDAHAINWVELIAHHSNVVHDWAL